MNANLINEIIDKGEDIGEDIMLQLMVDKMLLVLALSPSGFLGIICIKLLSFSVKKFVFPVLGSFKRNKIQYNIDVKAGKIYLKRMDKIDENTTLDDVIDVADDY